MNEEQGNELINILKEINYNIQSNKINGLRYDINQILKEFITNKTIRLKIVNKINEVVNRNIELNK